MSERSGHRGIRGHRMRTGGRRRHAGRGNRIRALRGLLRQGDAKVHAICEKLGASVNGNVLVSRDPRRLQDATFVVEAIVEDPEAKAEFWRRLDGHLSDDAVLATTTSSLPVSELAEASGHPSASSGCTCSTRCRRWTWSSSRSRTRRPPRPASGRARCAQALGKTAVEVPDTPGFVVNRLLFPFLFEAVRLMERTGLEAEAIDTCMQLGAGHPMGPLALLDLVGLDVSAAIAQTIGVEVPARVQELIAEGALGRKSGRGFHRY